MGADLRLGILASSSSVAQLWARPSALTRRVSGLSLLFVGNRGRVVFATV